MPTEGSVEEDAFEDYVESESSSKQLSSDIINLCASETVESESESAVSEKSIKLSSQRSSNRLTKRPRKDSNSGDTSLKKAVDIKPDTSTIRSKTRRPWELWSVEDKNAFFEALCEFGKDFESIQSYIAQRSKKKGNATNMIKNKDQVRHFYYRTWHKISKFLKINESVQKQTQELYGLINYAELRKKISGCLNEKNRLKLNELVFNGVTTVKHKGKKLRIKTPVCRALKKLNNFSDSKEPDSEKLPKDIYVEFRPHTNAAWLQVQNLAQNPRVRTKVCLQKRLRPVIEYLQRRWRPYRLKQKEQITNSLPNCNSEEFCDIEPLLRVKPSRGIKIFPLSMSAVDTASSTDVCLEKYLKLSDTLFCKDVNKSKKVIHTKLKLPFDKLENCETLLEGTGNNSDNTGEHTENNCFVDNSDLCQKGNKILDDGSYINILTPPKSVPEVELSTEHNLIELPISTPPLTSCEEPSTKQLNASINLDFTSEEFKSNAFQSLNERQNLDLFKDIEPKSMYDDKHMEESKAANYNIDGTLIPSTKFLSSETTEKEKVSEEKNELCKSNISDDSDSIYSKTIKQGWTVDEAGFLTFGELYLMFGKPTVIILEYEFEYPEKNFESSEHETEMTDTKSLCLSPLLNKVFELAHSFYTDNKHKQLPGKQQGRNNMSKSKLKTCGLNDKLSKDFLSHQVSTHLESNVDYKDVNKSENIVTITSQSSGECSSSTLASDKHVFARPIGTAPRNIKHPDQNSLKEELGKLLPSTRRGCRVRRKPLVVQRPLLPREGMRPISGVRPMTVVHFVPSAPPITTVIPPVCHVPKNKIHSAAGKNFVKILPPGLPLDIHPIQVPVVKQLQPDNSQVVIMERSAVASSSALLNSKSSESSQIKNTPMTSINTQACETNVNVESRSSQEESSPSEVSSSNNKNAVDLGLLTEQNKNVQDAAKNNFCTLSQLSPNDVTGSLISSKAPAASFLDEFGMTKKSMYNTSHLSLCLSTEVAQKECTSSENSSQHPFSAEIQWFNGESTELSLNTFLNSMDSPSKNSSISSNIVTENSNLDTIGRLAPVVDSQVRCLLDECSIDFITKFEDLADVINNSSSSDSKQA